jgi:ATP-dependent Clp protease ATP-binding subunit ClpC
VLAAAQAEAFGRNQPAYDQDDLLFGIAVVPDSAGLEVLRRLGISQERLRSEVDAAIAATSGPPAINVNRTSGQLRPAPRAQATLTLAADEARDLKHGYVGVEHLLLGMLRQGAGPGYVVLTHLGVTLDPARAALGQYLSGMVVGYYDANGDAHAFTVPVPPPVQ